MTFIDNSNSICREALLHKSLLKQLWCKRKPITAPLEPGTLVTLQLMRHIHRYLKQNGTFLYEIGADNPLTVV